MLYHPTKGNITNLPYNERRVILADFLNGQKLTHVQLSQAKVVHDRKALMSAIDWARRIPGSEGAMLKSVEHTITLNENDLIAKIKGIREIKGIVWDMHPVKGSPGVYNYFYAIGPVSADEALTWKETVRLEGKTYVKACRTFNSKVEAKVGNTLRIEVTEMLVDESDPEAKRFRGFTPTVVDTIKEGPSSIVSIRELLDPSELKKSGADDSIAKSISRGDWSVHIAKQKEDECYILGVVLEPDVVDSQGDIYSEEEVRKASEYFMEYARELGLMHKMALPTDKIKILENYIAPVDFELNGQSVRKGTWLLAARIIDADLWKQVKAGQLTGWSIEGSAFAQLSASAPASGFWN
jgi:hypothetical protein